MKPAAALLLALPVLPVFLAAPAAAAVAAQWSCFGNKPGHPTPAQRAAFIREVSELAVKAEKAHGVPAAALAAIAIAESGYGWTRIALEANNLFAWKFGSSARRDGRVPYALRCRKGASRYVTFKSRAEAFDYVAGKLATLEAYRAHTEAFQAARRRGEPTESAVRAWLSGIGERYSRKPEQFTRKIGRIINNPDEPADTTSPAHTLYRLSPPPLPAAR